MDSRLAQPLGAPSIQLNALRIWVHGRQFPQALDFWDGNWLNLTAHCATAGASVWTSGPVLHLSDLQAWHAALERMQRKLTDEAELKSLEPELRVRLQAHTGGSLAMTVYITPDREAQEHYFRLEVEQTCLPGFLGQCERVLSTYPIRDPGRSLPTGRTARA